MLESVVPNPSSLPTPYMVLMSAFLNSSVKIWNSIWIFDVHQSEERF